ncbi:MspA family protein [Mycolicibacterium rhodesiae JS60]|nr:MspA family protein [Mycolicibacterium rhodesiae JS60]
MLYRFATAAAVCMLIPMGSAPLAWADPADPAAPPVADVGAPPPPDNGLVPSGPPGIAKTPDGRTLTVVARDETQLPVAPLTTSLSSRDWVVGATFTGTAPGGVSGGTLETGYQIGCGVEMDKIKLIGGIGASLGSTSLGTGGVTLPGSISFPISGQVEVNPRPGTITNVVVDKKKFKGTSARVTLKDIHIKIDNCVGASSLRSYAVLTSSGTDADDIVAYYGIAKVF